MSEFVNLSLVSSEALQLILMPTEKCNFRCTYCYETFYYRRMLQSTIDGVKLLLSKRIPALRFLTLDWFGGEPLLALPVIDEIQSHAVLLTGVCPDLRFRAGATTNGYLLTPEVLARLVVLGVCRYQISLDGPAAAHDLRRVRRDGSGTFARIWSNLLSARDSDLDFLINLRLHVDRENQDVVPDLVDEIAHEFGGDDRFEVFIRHIARLGGPLDDVLPILEGDELDVIGELRRYAFEKGLRLHEHKGPDACYAAAANSFVIRSTGEIAKCTVALNHPNNRVGWLNPDGTATIDQGKFQGWVRGLLSGEAAELRCPMKGYADHTLDEPELEPLYGIGAGGLAGVPPGERAPRRFQGAMP